MAFLKAEVTQLRTLYSAKKVVKVFKSMIVTANLEQVNRHCLSEQVNFRQPRVCSEASSLKQAKHSQVSCELLRDSLPWGPTEESQPGRCKKIKVGNCCSRWGSRGRKGVYLLLLVGSGASAGATRWFGLQCRWT